MTSFNIFLLPVLIFIAFLIHNAKMADDSVACTCLKKAIVPKCRCYPTSLDIYGNPSKVSCTCETEHEYDGKSCDCKKENDTESKSLSQCVILCENSCRANFALNDYAYDKSQYEVVCSNICRRTCENFGQSLPQTSTPLNQQFLILIQKVACEIDCNKENESKSSCMESCSCQNQCHSDCSTRLNHSLDECFPACKKACNKRHLVNEISTCDQNCPISCLGSPNYKGCVANCTLKCGCERSSNKSCISNCLKVQTTSLKLDDCKMQCEKQSKFFCKKSFQDPVKVSVYIPCQNLKNPTIHTDICDCPTDYFACANNTKCCQK